MMPTVVHEKFRLPEDQPMSYRRALLAIGNGDIQQGQQNLFMLARRLEVAPQKHPRWSKGTLAALHIICEEYVELVCACECESSDRQLDEALDVATTAMRFVNREYMRPVKGGKDGEKAQR